MRSGVVTFVFAIATAGTGAACTLFTSFGSDLTGGDPSPDAASVGDAAIVEAGASADAGADAATDLDAAGSCVPGARLAPVRVFDPSPTPGFACAVDNVLAEDGKVAGIDRGLADGVLDGSNVTGCLGVELAEAADQVTVRAQPTNQGCLTRCGANCGTGHDFVFFAGASATDLEKVTNIAMTSTALENYVVPIPPTGIRFFAVCRNANGDSRDDVAVDVIHGRCR